MRAAVTLILADVAVTASVLLLSMWFREVLAPAWLGVDAFAPAVSYATLWPVVLLLTGARASFGLYPGHGVSDVDQLRDQTLSTTLVAAALFAGGTLFRFSTDYSRVVLVTWFVGLVVLLPLVRTVVRRLLGTRAWFGIPVHLYASDPDVNELAAAMLAHPGFGLRPISHELPATAAVIHLDHVDDRVWDVLASRYPRVWALTTTWLAALPAAVTEIDGRVALELRARLLEPSNRIVKRVLDIVLSLVAAPAVLLVGLVVAIAIRIDGRGPVFIRHTRIGRRGAPLEVLKFRTMVPDAAERLNALLASDPLLAAEWNAQQKLRHDPRVTRVGRFLRATSLDELPQAWNVLRGQMSWVGPRPVVADELERYGSQRDLYLRAIPGITGLVQVSGRSDLPYERRVELDAHYVRNWSVWLDLVILARTVDAVVRRRGAV